MVRSTILISCLVFATPMFAAEAALTDGQRAQVLITLSKTEIDAAKLAESKSQSKVVKSFAKMMHKQHEQNLKDTENLVKKMGWTPEDSDTSRKLAADAVVANEKLSSTSAGGFDRDYMGTQMRAHEGALHLLDQDLIPNSQDSALKNHLAKTREAVSMHFKHAEKVGQKLKVKM